MTSLDFKMEFRNIDGTNLMVLKPTRALSDSEYDAIKEYIECMGGHWRERVKGFTFRMEDFRRDREACVKEAEQFFATPDEVAYRVFGMSGIQERHERGEGIILLEPSAGNGSLLRMVPMEWISNYYVVEPIKERVYMLMQMGYEVYPETFEMFYERESKAGTKVTNVMMNPPFSKSRDIKHVMMAYEMLAPGGVLVAVMSENAFYYKNRTSESFRSWLNKIDYTVESIPNSAFKESGTSIDTVILRVSK